MLIILHISDIHLHSEEDVVLQRIDAISRATYPYIADAQLVLVIVSGDVAQSGLQAEYNLGRQLMSGLVSNLRSQTKASVHVVLSPGNHDCDFSGDQEGRLAIVSAIQKRSGPPPRSFVDIAVAPQEQFSSFREDTETAACIENAHPLWRIHSFEIGGSKIIVDSLNASWMSTRHEQQGNLVFPYEMFDQLTPAGSALRIGVLHHPFNWYSQANYRAFRDFVHGLEDIIFTGHEHESAGRYTDDAASGECFYVEGSVLQDRKDPQVSGFNVVIVDLGAKAVKYIPHLYGDDIYEPQETRSDWHEYRALPKRSGNTFELTSLFRSKLHDPGATLKHPSGRVLSIDDIYVHPDLDGTGSDSESGSGKTGKLSSRWLHDFSAVTQNVLISGPEACGRTQLLLRLFCSYYAQGFIPLYVKGRDFKSSVLSNVDKVLETAVRSQYGSEVLVRFRQLEKERKVLLLDDLDEVPLRNEAGGKLLAALQLRFGRVITTVAQEFYIASMVGGEDPLRDMRFRTYQLLPFGYERRSELVRKWVSFGMNESDTANDILKIIDESEQLIESARLQHVASTVPIYVLSLLQASASGLSHELHNSSFAHYYYFLVVGALEKGGVNADDIASYLAVCTHLSWYIRTNGSEQRVTDTQYRMFVDEYSTRWTRTDPAQLLDILKSARLVELDGGYLSFTYPYAYYYFLGRYANLFISNDDVNQYLSYCFSNLYVRECANTLLFLAHHSGNSQVLDAVVDALKDHFSGMSPMRFIKEDVRAVSELISFAPKVTYRQRKPLEYRQDLARQRDDRVTGDNLSEKPSGAKDLFHEIIALVKAVEIAGALLTHQYSSYENVRKTDAVKEIFDASMRTVREMYSHFENEPEQLINAIADRYKRAEDISDDQAVLRARRQIGLFLCLLATGFVAKAGAHLTSPKLEDHVEAVVSANPSPANRLIRISQKLQSPNRLPRADIERLLKEEDGNPCVMAPLQLLVLRRMYMYHTDYDDKDWAMSVFQLGSNTERAIDFRNRNRSRGRIPSLR